MQWRMDLIEANMERRLNVLEAIQFAFESWNSVGGEIIWSCWIKSGFIEAPQAEDLRAQNDYRQSSLSFQQDCYDLADVFQKLGVTVSVDDYVEIEDYEQIHEEQEALIEAEVEPAEVESDEDQAPVSAKEALTCCLLLRSYFIRSDANTRIIHSDLDKMSSVIHKNRYARAKQLDMRDFI